MASPKGIILAVVSALVFAPWFVSVFLGSTVAIRPPLEQVRRFGPLGLLVFTVASLLFSVGEQALYYSPAEVTFLFAGPYRKRTLLAYKLHTTFLLCLVSAIFFTFMSNMLTPKLISAFVGSLLVMVFLQMLQMALGLAASTLGKLAWSRSRQLVLLGLAILVGLAIVSVGRDLAGLGPMEALKRVEQSSVASIVLTPFRWFVLTFTSERIWPDLLKWAGLAGIVDLILIGVVFGLDASYLEAASNSSARRFAKLRKIGAGGGSVRSTGSRRMGRFRFRPPTVPWWGGVGPNFWRQMIGALGDPFRLLGVVMMLSSVPIVLIVLAPRDPKQLEPMPYVCMGMIGWMSIILSILMPFDFRGDVDNMEELKSLPIQPNRVAIGQLLTPTLVATASQALAMLTVLVGLGGAGVVGWAFLAFLLPINFLFYAVENLLFLWYPTRVVAGQFDVMAIGRQVLFMLAKVLGLSIGVGVAALIGIGVYFVSGRSVLPALLFAWLSLSGVAMAVIPLVGQAFERFDVTGDIPA